MNGGWDDAREATLRQLRAEGQSYAQIARAIGGGITRYAVGGKLRKLGLLQSVVTAPALAPQKTRVVLSRDTARSRGGVKAHATRKRREGWRAALAVEPTLPADGVTFTDRNAGACAFPLWSTGSRPTLDEMRFCGAPADVGRSYCPRCCAIMYQGGQRPATQVSA